MQTYLDGKTISPFSICSIPIDIEVRNKMSDSEEYLYIASATGFLVDVEGKLFLVSNWHVFSGHEFNNAYTDLVKEPHGALPERITLHGLVKEQRVSLLLSDTSNTPLWSHDKESAVDIAVMELSPNNANAIRKLGWHAINEIPSQEDLLLEVTDSVFIVGYPYGKRASMEYNAMPIYKSGSIASEPALSYFPGRKSFLIDSITRPGMSGSPVIAVSHNGYISDKVICIDGSTYYKFLGIYSGRIDGDMKGESSLGIVWDKSLIFKIIADEIAKRAS
ncbi:trypsin-like peptidase domain-containing protein [Candidatus Saccharibacteria bacterium]|nr:trypsin-like peptidase domain-containing protein [Candidatus Saccharibacteria bacterium]